MLDGKRKDYISAMENLDDAGDHLLRLLFADSASVIQDCIELVSETAQKSGITIP